MTRPVAIIYSLHAEITALLPLVQEQAPGSLKNGQLINGTLEGCPVVLVKAGVGGSTLDRLLAEVKQQVRPARYILIGFTGAADPALPAGTVVIPAKLITIDGEEIAPDAPGEPVPDGICRDAVMVTVSRIYGHKDKRKLYGPFSRNRVVDMESGYLASWARREGVSYLVVKAVSDGFKTDLPKQSFIKKFFGKGQPGGYYIKAALTNPLQFYRLSRLNKNCRLAAARLAPVVQAVVAAGGA